MDFRALLELIRVGNCLMTAVAVAIGYYLVTLDTTCALGIAMISAFLICAGGQAINDVYDVDIDKKISKKRPIPSGRVPKQFAYRLSITLFIAGILVSLALTQTAIIIAVAISVLLFAYAARLYKAKYIGNFIVALGTALPFAFGAAAAMMAVPALVIVLSMGAFFANLGREVTKDFEDLKKDRGFKRTMPMIHPQMAKSLIAAYYVAAVLLGIYAYISFSLGTAYIIITVLAAFVFLYTALLAEKGKYTKSQKTSKKGMFVYLIALIAAIVR